MQAATTRNIPASIPTGYVTQTRQRPARGYAYACPSLTLAPVNDFSEPADETLMLAYAAGDMAAFEQLYSRHRTRLYRFLLRQLRDPALADEFFQEVWQRVISARADWKPDAAFTTWLYRIAHNRLTDHWRALKHRPPAPADGDERAARVPDPDTPERNLSDFEHRRRRVGPGRGERVPSVAGAGGGAAGGVRVRAGHLLRVHHRHRATGYGRIGSMPVSPR